MSARLRVAVLLGASSLSASGAALAAQAALPPRASLPTIERQVMCVTCKIPLNVAVSPQADRERAFIAHLIESGHSEAQVKHALVSQYGPAVLALPGAHGFDVVAYVVPAAALLALAAMLVVLLGRWRARGRAQPALEPPPQPLSQAEAARLDADMARFD
jgi:cytochrome c-type biogenesis protein CcmH